ncbi:MAG: alpha-mannosidase, partial [Promethearchaeota archaeon]
RAYKTFYAALKHIKEFPYFSVSMTTPQYFNWIKRYDPEMWEDVKEQVARNKIDICGGMWVEPALRMCSGEALVRQRLYGQLYYLRNFGKISKVESLLDVFGFPYSLPQILVKSGAESFWTTKILWNDHSDFPFSNYIWRGIDGSKIFTHLFKFQIGSIMDFGLYKKMGRRPNAKDLVFNSHNTLEEMNSILTPDHVRTLGWFYGRGDGGKGPLFTEIQYMENFAKYFGNFSKGFKHTNTHRYFQILKEDVGDTIVTWDDEMYLEFHRGCLTTQARVKEGNRKSEELTVAAEFLNTSFLLTPEFSDFSYPKEVIDDCWQKTMFNQFHDILPGSSIPEVYLLTWKEHDFVKESMKSLLNVRLFDITTKILTKPGDILLYNPVSVKNDAIISDGKNEHLIKNIEPLSLFIINQQDLENWAEEHKGRIQVESLPSSIRVENDFLTVSISKNTGNLIQLNLKNQKEFTNFLYGERNAVRESTEKRVMKDNTIKKNKLRFKGARVNAFGEPHKNGQSYPAWNIDRNYTSHHRDVTLIKSPEITKSDTKVIISSTYSMKNSKIIVAYTLRANSEVLDIDIKIDLQDNRTLLKYFIPLNLKSDQVRCEIPYGSIIRTRNPKTKMEEGKWESGMQKWVDVGDDDLGLAILNDSKYGVSANMKGISITLVRSPHYPKDPYHTREIKIDPKERPQFTDFGTHDIKLRLVPHKDSWIEQEIPHKALAFNNPVLCTGQSFENQGALGNADQTLATQPSNLEELPITEVLLPKITSDHQNVIVSTFKPTEWVSRDSEEYLAEKSYDYEDYSLPESPDEWVWDKKTLVIRAYECGGVKISTPIRLHNIPESMELVAEEIDLLEYKIGKKLDVVRNMANNTVVIHTEFTPFEIKSIRLIVK